MVDSDYFVRCGDAGRAHRLPKIAAAGVGRRNDYMAAFRLCVAVRAVVFVVVARRNSRAECAFYFLCGGGGRFANRRDIVACAIICAA